VHVGKSYVSALTLLSKIEFLLRSLALAEDSAHPHLRM
jgi:hypothetical protein